MHCDQLFMSLEHSHCWAVLSENDIVFLDLDRYLEVL